MGAILVMAFLVVPATAVVVYQVVRTPRCSPRISVETPVFVDDGVAEAAPQRQGPAEGRHEFAARANFTAGHVDNGVQFDDGEAA